jgi:hypothetical protein
MKRFAILAATMLLATPVVCAQEKPRDVPVSEIGSRYRLIGKLQKPLGSVVTVQGVYVNAPFKSKMGGPNLRVQKINGRATQQDIWINLAGPQESSELAFGKTYELGGYEGGGFVGISSEAYERFAKGISARGFHFRTRLFVYTSKPIDPIVWAPSDFVERKAMIAGRAVSQNNKSYIVSTDWRLLVDANAAWPKHVGGKQVEGWGVIRKTDQPKAYRLENGTTRLVRLEDQIGREVALRGRAWQMDGRWFFNYRGIDVYVDNTEDMPKRLRDPGAGPVLISGLLAEAMLPEIDEILFEKKPELRKQFIIRSPSWKPTDALLSPERVELVRKR